MKNKGEGTIRDNTIYLLMLKGEKVAKPVRELVAQYVNRQYIVTCRRQKDLEEKLIEEEVAKRVEELVAQRVEEELEKRKDEIEQEVLRRVEEAKRIMEKQMLEEMERQRQVEMEAQKKKEVKSDTNVQPRGSHGMSNVYTATRLFYILEIRKTMVLLLMTSYGTF